MKQHSPWQDLVDGDHFGSAHQIATDKWMVELRDGAVLAWTFAEGDEPWNLLVRLTPAEVKRVLAAAPRSGAIESVRRNLTYPEAILSADGHADLYMIPTDATEQAFADDLIDRAELLADGRAAARPQLAEVASVAQRLRFVPLPA